MSTRTMQTTTAYFSTMGSLYGGQRRQRRCYMLSTSHWKVLWDGRDDAEKRAPKGSVAFADGGFIIATEKEPCSD